MTAESSFHNLSPRSAVRSGDGDADDNPQFQQRNLPSVWTAVVRGEHEAITVAPCSLSSSSSSSSSPPPSQPVAKSGEATFTDCSDSKETRLENPDNNVGHPNKPAWNKPLNGVVGGPVMGGAVSWPALSESTRPPLKSTVDSSKPISDASVSTSQVPVISHSLQNQKHANTNPSPKSTPNNTMPVRQRSSKRGGGTGGGSVQSGFSRLPRPPLQPPLPPPFPLFEIPYGALVGAMPDSSFREPPYKGNNWEGRPIGGFVSQPPLVHDQSLPRNSVRRGNFGGRLRGEGRQHNIHGSRRDQDRDWNTSRSFNSRDVQVPQQMASPRGFIRPPPPPPGSTPFFTSQPVRPYGNPMGFDMTSQYLYVPTLPPESFMGVPFIAHSPQPAMFFPVPDPALPIFLVNQIDYYFSDANLVKDDFLRSKMDHEGWVPIDLIASFPRVKQLTNDMQFILDSLSASAVVEVQGDKVRRRNVWRTWLPPSDRFPTDSGSQSPVGSTYNALSTSLQMVTLDEETSNEGVL